MRLSCRRPLPARAARRPVEVGAVGAVACLLAASGCAAHTPTTTDAPAASAASATDVLRIPLPGLVDVACAPDCLALTARGLVRVPEYTPIAIEGLPARATALDATEAGWRITAPCPDDVDTPCRFALTLAPPAVGPPSAAPAPVVPVEEDAPPLTDQMEAFSALFGEIVAHAWRVPFRRTLVGPGGGPISLGHVGSTGGQLVTTGPPPHTTPLPVVASPATWPAPLSLRPDGNELYVVAWPSPAVRAFDPLTLAPRWTAQLDDAGQGLFVDPGGRFLLVGEGPAATERFVDWPLPAPAPPFVGDPTADERLRVEARPPMSAAAVVDLAHHAVAVRARGSYRRFRALPGAPARYLLATDQEVVFFTPTEPR